MNRNYFLEAAEYAGFTLEFAESNLDAYLDTRGEAADIESFVTWLAAKEYA